MRVHDVMTRSVISVSPETPLKQVAELLVEKKISGVPVMVDGAVVGIVSESDIVAKEHGPETQRPGLLERAAHRGRKSVVDAATAEEAMSGPPVTVEPWMSVHGAAWLMCDRDVNRLPVVERRSLVGIVTRADLVRAFARSDDDIAAEIRTEILPSLSLSPNEVSIGVERGVVTLAGDLEELDLAELPRAVKRVVGVVRVEWEREARVPA
jgi:CBS domain-containing protein